MVDLPTGLCHYTDSTGLLGITKDKELWATHIFYLNDHAEYRFAFDAVHWALTAGGRLKESLDAAPDFRDAVASGLSFTPRNRPASVFVVSFSTEWDDLSQWRAYTSPGDGYGLIFDPQHLRERARRLGWRLEPCVYGTPAHQAVYDLLLEAFDSYRSGAWAEDGDPIQSAFDDLQEKFLLLAPLLKHAAFASEREWRLISPIMDDIQPKAFEYRSGPSFIVPFLKFRYADGDERAIIQMTLGPGPNQDLAGWSIGFYIVQKGMNIGYSPSQGPYRPW